MPTYPVPIINVDVRFGATIDGSDPGVVADPDFPAVINLPPESDFLFDLDDVDYTGEIVTGSRIEIDIESGQGDLFWIVWFEASGYFALGDTSSGIQVDGPQNFVKVLTEADVVDSFGAGGTYSVPAMVERITNTSGYHHGYGQVEASTGTSTDIVVSAVRFFFQAAAQEQEFGSTNKMFVEGHSGRTSI